MNYRLELTNQFRIFKNIDLNQTCKGSFSSNSINMRRKRSQADGQSDSPRIGENEVFYDPRILFLSPWLPLCSGAQCLSPTEVITNAGKGKYQQENGRKLSEELTKEN